MIFFLLFAVSAHATPKLTEAQKAAQAFYQHYVDYQHGLEGKSRPAKQAKAEDEAAVRSYLSPTLLEQLRAQEKKCAGSKDEILEGCDSDPFYCAQEPPVKGAAVVQPNGLKNSNQLATVGINLCFPTANPKKCEGRIYEVTMEKSKDGKWLVNHVRCPK